MASKKDWKRRTKLAIKSVKRAVDMYMLEQLKNRLLLAALETLSKNKTADAVAEEKEESQSTGLFDGYVPFSEQTTVNGQDVNKLIRENPTLTNTQIGDLVGVSHQFITAWKIYHDGWKGEVDAEKS